MSGILGIIYADNRPVEPKILAEMTAKLAHRGLDGIHLWHQGAIGLGHLMLRTTPESVGEQLPLVNSSGNLALTADGRIDNRDELIDSLRLEDNVTDSQIILSAYEKWGTSCCQYLLGDFAFALWDEHQQRLFCGRDHIGVRPFFYYHSPELFIFASEIKALLAVPNIPKQLYEPWIATHLTLVKCHEPGTTFYKDIFRLLPGNQLIFSDNRIHLETYWKLDPTKNIVLQSEAEYTEAFREIFTEAVHCRLRSAYPVGSMLSGGLDSASVTSVAGELLRQNNQQPLYTYSAFFTQSNDSDERPYIDAVLAQGSNFIPYRIDGNEITPNEDIETMLWHLDEPFWYPFLLVNWELYKQARSQGVRILLDGIDGDTTVAACQDSYLNELLRTGRWLQMLSEIEGMANRFGDSRLSNMKHYVLSPILKQPTVKAWNRLRGKKLWKAGLINSDFAQHMNVEQCFQLQGGYALEANSTARESHYRRFSSYSTILELLNKSGAAFGIEYRHPFTDKRLVEFCLALPAEQKFHQGITRAVMRRGLAHVLPEIVQQRRGKGGVSHQYCRNLLTASPTHWDKVILNDVKSLEAYIDLPKLRDNYHCYLDLNQEKFVVGVCHSAILALWLHKIGF
ncbi:MAG: lasso peptide isopeptide bond-forming cyclase [Aphanothece sp. CMT-3BRIN-NPC111]|jgi:asparagine synthase (glutamine-hydrolysing)|nr:lasso peptide isopeptide bond-forming cyclase [Aphanothece sp. CMT-3BRIN-NPC111]